MLIYLFRNLIINEEKHEERTKVKSSNVSPLISTKSYGYLKKDNDQNHYPYVENLNLNYQQKHSQESNKSSGIWDIVNYFNPFK